MNCPNCKKEVKIDRIVFLNCEAYGNTNLAVSECCGIAFNVKAVVSFDVTPYEGDEKEDNWGAAFFLAMLLILPLMFIAALIYHVL